MYKQLRATARHVVSTIKCYVSCMGHAALALDNDNDSERIEIMPCMHNYERLTMTSFRMTVDARNSESLMRGR